MISMAAHLEINMSVNSIGVKKYSFYGELDELNVDGIFNSIIADIGDFTGARIIFQFWNLKYLNSKGIGWLADIAQRVQDGGGKLVLCDLTQEIRDTLELDGIATIIPICVNEREADEQFVNNTWFSE